MCIRDRTWGDYVRSSEKYTGKDEKEHSRAIYTRQPMEETVRVNFSDFGRTQDYQLLCDSNVHVHVSRIPLKGGYSQMCIRDRYLLSAASL